MKYLILIAICTFLFGCYSKEPEKTGLEGKTMPSFSLRLLDSTNYLDTKDIPAGQPIVLFYYGPHCPYSRAQMEEMMQNMNILKKVRFYTITTWPYADMKKFSEHYKISKYSNITAGADTLNFIGNYFKITAVPFTAIYDRDKKLFRAFEGKIFVKQIVKAIQELE